MTTVCIQRLEQFLSNQDKRQSSKKHNKYQLLYTYDCTSWWWALIRPKSYRLLSWRSFGSSKIPACSYLVLLFFLDDCLLSWLHWICSKRCIHPVVVYIRLYLLMTGVDTSEKCRGWRNVLRISCVSSWFFFTRHFSPLLTTLYAGCVKLSALDSPLCRHAEFQLVFRKTASSEGTIQGIKNMEVWRWQVRVSTHNSNKLTNQMQQFHKLITWCLCFAQHVSGRLHAHYQELTTALTL